MRFYETTLESLDGLRLFAQGWEPENAPRAVICLIHGLNEHSGRFAHVGAAFNAVGIAMLSFDLRGHGESEGQRGHTPSSQAYLEDIDLLVQEADRLYPEVPVFLYGHSLGGILALYYVLKRKPAINGVISSSPGLRTSLEEQTFKVALAKTLGGVFPTMSVPSGIKCESLTRDPKVNQAYSEDPLVGKEASLGFAISSLKMIEWTYEHAAEFPVPLLIQHGSEDELAYAHGSEEFAGYVGDDCTLKLWQGFYHELHNEPEKEQVLSFVIEWIENQLP